MAKEQTKRRPGRPRTNVDPLVRTEVYLQEKLRNRLDRYCERSGVTMREAVETALGDFLPR